MVPKPHYIDYSLAKNFCPVSLLECMGKIIEKLMACLFYSEIIRHDLLPTNQFGGRMASSILDTGLSLMHDIYSRWLIQQGCKLAFCYLTSKDTLTISIGSIWFKLLQT